jgi:dihydrodipicolinate synthase/N-acetylneuraminate lyase
MDCYSSDDMVYHRFHAPEYALKTTPVTPEDLAGSVFAVPPLARRPDLSLDPTAQQTLVRHIEAGGIRTVLYGGNANLYHMGLREYPAFLELAEATAGPDTWVIPSAGPDFGKLMDQALYLRTSRFPTVMVLPMAFPSMPGGVARAIQAFTEAIARPVVLYLKTEQQMQVDDVARLVDKGLVCAIKYAIPRQDPTDDAFLTALLSVVDRRWIACGLAERAALVHLFHHRLVSYTSGGICIAPRLSAALLKAAQAGDANTAARFREAFLPLEAQRERSNVFATLHEAVSMSGIADMGTVLPMLERIAESDRAALRPIVRDLVAAEAALTH